MQYDSGEVLPGLNENWTFLGANPIEWGCGFVVFIIISLFGNSPATMMPFMLIGWVSTTVTLANMRRVFPDEERGLRNALLTACGICPPDIPPPSRLQPVWSPCPVQELPENSQFVKLGLDRMFPSFHEELEPAEDSGE